MEWKDSGNHGLYGGIFNRTGDSNGTETASLYEVLEFGGARVAHLFSFLCCVFVFVCLRPVSCVPNVTSVSGFSILDWLFGFL